MLALSAVSISSPLCSPMLRIFVGPAASVIALKFAAAQIVKKIIHFDLQDTLRQIRCLSKKLNKIGDLNPLKKGVVPNGSASQPGKDVLHFNIAPRPRLKGQVFL